jgi:hypothetical protein
MEMWTLAEQSPRQLKRLIENAKKRRLVQLHFQLREENLQQSHRESITGFAVICNALQKSHNIRFWVSL